MPEEKKIDESWKEKVEKEKDEQPDKAASTQPMPQDAPEANFILFISGLGMQALMNLGLMENPATQKIEKDLIQAKYIIDTLDIIKTKTKGNLSAEEEHLMDELLYELKMKYVSAAK